MKKVYSLLSSLLLVCLMSAVNAAPATESLDGIAAYVNREVITTSELQRQFAIAKAQLVHSNTTLPADSIIKQKVLDQLIAQRLQIQKAKEANINVDDKTVDLAINNIAKQNQMTLEQLKQAVVQQGMNFSEYREDIRTQIIVSHVQQQAVGSTISVTPAEVAAILKKGGAPETLSYHVQNILVPIANNPSPKQVDAARSKAEALLNKLRQGGNFSAAAVAPSAGDNALQGGDLGWRPLAELPEIFANRVKTMKTGDIAGPIQAPNGFHLLKLVATKATNPVQQLTHEQAQQMVYARKLSNAVDNWVNQLRAGSYIKIGAIR